MVKILICGDLGNGNSDGKAEWLTLCARLHALQNSAHGPFAMLLVAGGFFASRKQVQEAVAASQSGEEASSFPMPCFAIDGKFEFQEAISLYCCAALEDLVAFHHVLWRH